MSTSRREPNPTRREFLELTAAGALALTAGAAFAEPSFDQLVPPDKHLPADQLARLTARGAPTMWTGEALHYIGMPCGGLTCGQLYLGGDGRLWHWDVQNLTATTGDAHYAHPMEPSSPLEQGAAVAVTPAGGATQIHTLDRDGFANVRFRGAYPIAAVDYADPACPVSVRLTAGSPFIPLDLTNSSIPATLLHYEIVNSSAGAVEVEIASWLENKVCLACAETWGLTRVNRVVKSTGLLGVELSASLPKPRSNPRAMHVLADFNGETWGDWQAEGAAFAAGPQHPVSPDQHLSSFQGKGLVNTYLGSDEPTGSLTSPEFVIDRTFINFLIAGGHHPGETCMNLLVGGKAVRTATGHDSDAMLWHSWNVGEYEGQSARLEILDKHSGGWGHIDIDEIELSDSPKTAQNKASDEPDWGTMCLALLDAVDGDRAVTALPAGEVPAGVFGSGFAGSAAPANGELDKKLIGCVSRRLRLAPGQRATVTFAVTWHFANLFTEGSRRGQYYSTRYASAVAVAQDLAKRHHDLWHTTNLWVDTWYDSTLPYWLLDRTHQNVSTLATGTTQRWANGRPWGWEGVGCCTGTCTHVWYYAQAAARLFPEFERGVREMQDFGTGFDPATGQVGMRGEWNHRAAVDGQCGAVLRALREHQISTDGAFLKRLWPRVKQAIDWLISQDGNADGYIERGEHNTLDVDWYGPHPWFNSLYLAALRAGASIADEFGEPRTAQSYRALVASGVKLFEARLWNGEYYWHLKDPKEPAAPGSGKGCEIDQIYGEHWAHMVDLPRVLDNGRVHQTLSSLYRYNFCPDVGPFRATNKSGRWYALSGEGGLIMCTFPKGGQDEAQGTPPVWSAMYFNECMNGFEHQAAAHMIYEGMVEQGLTIEKAIHDRYSAKKRNPFNEVECGDHYARSMASYGVFLAVCGFRYHGPQGVMGFDPRIHPENFKSAFTAAAGWGTYAQTIADGVMTAALALRHGELRLTRLELTAETANRVKATLVSANGQRNVPCSLAHDGATRKVSFAPEIVLREGEKLYVKLT